MQRKSCDEISRSNNRARPKLATAAFVLWSCMIVTAFPVVSKAQYKGDHIPGFLGLESGTQAPAGLYVGNVAWVYPTSAIKNNSSRDITLPGSLTSTADIILASVVTNYKLFGAHLGGRAAFPFIKNRIQLNSLDVNTGFAYTDMFIGASLGWHLKRSDITAGYNLYIPTGRFSQGGTDNRGLGIWGNELTVGSTIYLDQKRLSICPHHYCDRSLLSGLAGRKVSGKVLAFTTWDLRSEDYVIPSRISTTSLRSSTCRTTPLEISTNTQRLRNSS